MRTRPLGVIAAAAAAGPALAQAIDLDPDLPALPEPPFLQHHLFESPWAAVAVLLIAGLIAGEWFRRRGKGRPALAAYAAGALLAGGVWAASALVETPRERVARAARALVQAAGVPDGPRLRGMLDERVVVQTAMGRAEGADGVVGQAERYVPGFRITDLRTPEVRAAVYSPQLARTQVRVRLRSDTVPQNSWWSVDWALDASAGPDDPAGGWRATRIEPLWILGVPNPGG